MKRYVAFLRGVSPLNAKMPELKRAFELASFQDVKTVLSSGNLVFSARATTEDALAKKAEAAMNEHLGSSFSTLVRAVDDLRELLESDPYRSRSLAPGCKRCVTFLGDAPRRKPQLPLELEGAQIVALHTREVFSTYVGDRGSALMGLLEKTFGKGITTRTWQTVERVSK